MITEYLFAFAVFAVVVWIVTWPIRVILGWLKLRRLNRKLAELQRRAEG